ncbi:MAG: patatin-like phospholipase family protein [Acidimicrobiia bacterium]
MDPSGRPKRAFVLGGGGFRGAAEVGMLKALAEAGVEPDLIVGTSVGALNGAIVASRPLTKGVDRLEAVWLSDDFGAVFSEGLTERAANFVRHRTHLHSSEPLRRLIDHWAPATLIEDLDIPFQCVAARIETSSEVWFSEGPLADAVLASAAVPGLFAPVAIRGEHYVDGGVVNSIPISRALELGAEEIWVLQVGNVDVPLQLPRQAWDVAIVAFEVARRHRFHRDLETLPEHVTLRVLPTGADHVDRYNDPGRLRYRASDSIPDAIERAHRAAGDFLDEVLAR